mgnify:CR=1 FL=1
MTWWKGRKEVKFSLLGRGKDQSENIKKCEMMLIGLMCISNNEQITVVD